MHADHACARIDHGGPVVFSAHAACAAGMPDGLEAAADLGQELIVRLRAPEPWVVFRADENGGHGLGGEESAHALEGGDGDLLVGGVGEPAGIDDGGVGGVGGGDGHGSAGQGRDERGYHGAVVEAVRRRGEGVVPVIPEVTAYGQVFDFRPVGRKPGERVEGRFGQGFAARRW